MKKHLTLIAVAALTLAASCEREIARPEVIADSVADGVEMTFHAVADPGTRTQLEGKHVLWSPSDQISVFYNSKNNKFTSNNTEPAATVDFSGVIQTAHASDGAGSKVFAVAPYNYYNQCDGEYLTVQVSCYQYIGAETFDKNSFPSVAVTTTDELQFYNVAGGIKVRFTKENINSLTIEALGGETIAGSVKVGFGSDGVPYIKEYVDEYEYICAFPPHGENVFRTDCDYYVSILPATLSKGLRFTYEVNYAEAYKDYPSPVTFERNVFKSAKGIDKQLTYNTSVPWYPGEEDLGLSVMWGTANIGAESPEEAGWYYSWGEIEPKDDYSWSSYLWCNGTIDVMTKYNSSDGLVSLKPEDDPAAVKMKGKWRMPTAEEYQELLDNCEWTKTTQGGVVGFLVKSKKTGYTDKSIFLPSRGMYGNDTLEGDQSVLGYWTKDLYGGSSSYSAKLLVDWSGSKPSVSALGRGAGLPIRPIKERLTLKDFAKEFVKGLDKWEATVGTVESDDYHLMANGTAWEDAHYICVGKTGGEYDDHDGNQHDFRKSKQWTFNIDGTLYYAFDAWEIAIRGLLEMCTEEGQGFAASMTGPNSAPHLANGKRLDEILLPIPERYPWDKYPWKEQLSPSLNGMVYDDGTPVRDETLDMVIQACAWALNRAQAAEYIPDYVTFGTGSGDIDGYDCEGAFCSMRQLLVLMRIYKYLLDNDINSNVYSSIWNRSWDFDLYGSGAMSADGDTSDWDALPSSWVSVANTVSGASYDALKTLKAYANTKYIYLYLKWDPIVIPASGGKITLEMYMNGDGDPFTGGYGLFSDRCTELMMEGDLADGAQIIPFALDGVYGFTGALNSPDWEWGDAMSYADGLAVGNGADGKYEIRIDRSKYPGTLADNFSLGVTLMLDWARMGLLPNAEAPNYAPTLKVKTVK